MARDRVLRKWSTMTRPECQSSFGAEIEVAFSADIELLVSENSPMEVFDSERQISRAEIDNLLFADSLVARFCESRRAIGGSVNGRR